MRFFVKSGVCGQTHVIPCSDSTASVEKLKATIIARLYTDGDCANYRLSLAGCEAIINEKDAVQDVLQDGDCLSLSASGEQLLLIKFL